jgi:hypothetical protein
MTLFILVMLTIGAVTSFLYGTNAALQAGIKAMDFWILAGLAVVILGPILNLGWLLLSLLKRILHLFHRKAF